MTMRPELGHLHQIDNYYNPAGAPIGSTNHVFYLFLQEQIKDIIVILSLG